MYTATVTAWRRKHKVTLPEEVPILSRHHMGRGVYRDSSGLRCLMGWWHYTLSDIEDEILYDEGNIDFVSEFVFYRWIRKAVAEVDPSIGGKKCFCVETWNDESGASCELLSRIWNRAMYHGGYTEGNPEKKRLTPKLLKRRNPDAD